MNSSDDSVAELTSQEGIADAEFALRIYENGEQVGVVDLDAETYEYDGEKEGIDRLLGKMATEGFTRRVPTPRHADEQGRRVKGTTKRKRTGADLGRYLMGAIEEKGRDDEVRTEGVGFDPEYGFVEIGEHPESG